MSYNNREELRKHILRVGIFFNEEDDKSTVIGKLVSVTKNGNCECEGGVYFDEFIPMHQVELFKYIVSKHFSLNCA